ncbi:actin-like protein 6A [Heterostelium album PN500]|uniref:Actin-like protein 6A n=1 Tax=Heterostelium pallidum (strain ATCC 26659 / Pp 5 / PN500) TaxID=670386 RepID=D3B4M8_HETP5|nr:actin-like protein 6A [Heterostelium album PN500]EFA84276.1 actin-like protein 6A [Heterostelium album PN500]|eukprot:XP_020436392.1 actin-like protein 6A [Heterostelium album PN500]
MYGGGDDVSAVVLDVGTSYSKGGYAGEDSPKAIFPTDVGVTYTSGKDGMVGSREQGIGEDQDMDQDVKKTYYIGTNSITYKRPHMEIQNPLQDGLIKDWEAMEKIWNHAFRERLNINPNEHPILLAEPSFNTRQIREKVAELMFEKFHTPALFISKNAVLTSFASCKASSLVLDSGGGMTSIVPVHDGYAIKNAIIKSNLAGNKLSSEYYRVLSQKNIRINPHNLIKKTEIKHPEYNVSVIESPELTESYRRYVSLETIRDLKESSFRVSNGAVGDDINIATVPYELPDGNLLEVGSDRFQIPELMFNPTSLNDETNNYLPLPKMIYDSVEKCDTDIRKELIANLLLSGGNTLFQGFSDRLYMELGDLSQAFGKVKFVVPSANERKYSVWIGGSILGSLGTFQQMWMSKSEWEEFGRPLVEKKCP